MQWGLQVLPEIIIVRMFRSPDHSLGEMFEKAAERALSLENRRVVIDFSDVESFDSIGLMLCGYGIYHLRQLHIPVVLIRPPASLFPILQQHGVHELPPVFSHESDAGLWN
jgi:anti-anti-sigma regulatory factor